MILSNAHHIVHAMIADHSMHLLVPIDLVSCIGRGGIREGRREGERGLEGGRE